MAKRFFNLCLAVSICGLFSSVFAQMGWVLQPSIIKGDLNAVYFTSPENGWVAGDDGYLASTNDGGRSWAKYALNTTENINEIYFRNNDNGYVVAGKSILVTRDGGRTWAETRIYRDGEFGTAMPDFLSIRFTDKKRGYLVGSLFRRVGNDELVVDSLVMRTEDGGDTWRRVSVPTKTELVHVDFDGNSRGWIVGHNGVVLASSDEGNTWKQQLSGTAASLYNVDFRDKNEGYIVGSEGTILRTENGGATWEKVTTNFRDTFLRVDFADDKNGWIVGRSGSILRSSDKGKSWIRQESNTKSHLYGLFMAKKYGFAVGADGTVLQFTK